MFKNNFKIAWRNLLKDRRFTLLNLIGLSTGLACTFLVFLWIHRETSIDSFQPSGLYEIMQNVPSADKSLMTIEHTPDLLAKALLADAPGIADAATVKRPYEDDTPGMLSVSGENGFKATEVFATPNFFRLFSFKLIQGDSRVLDNPSSVLLSDRMAEKLFHSPAIAIGKTVNWYHGLNKKINGTYTVSGIFAAPDAGSSMQFDLVFPHRLYVSTATQTIDWNSNDPGTYVILKNGVTVAQMNRTIKNFVRAKTGDTVWTGTLFLQRFKDKYLHNQYANGAPVGGRIEYVRLFAIIALFLLVIACINFMNLSTAKASGRLKEIGIKKVIGAGRWSLIGQYLAESLLMALLAMLLAAVTVICALPYFEQLTATTIPIPLDVRILAMALLVTIITGLLAGSYPALYLSGFKPAHILKGTLNLKLGGAAIRKVLVVFQFGISVVLIIAVLVVYRQMRFIQQRNLGYDRADVITFKNEGGIQKNLNAFSKEVKNLPGVINVSAMNGDLFGKHGGGSGVDWPGKTTNIDFSGLYVDFGLMETLGLHLQQGRSLSQSVPADSNAVIFNETAILEMGLKNPIGKTVKLWGSEKTIIGVVKDFHYESLYKNIGPLFISYRRNAANVVTRLNPGAEKQTLAQIAGLYHRYNQGLPFEYHFLDEDYHALYNAEERVAALSRCFAAVAILISCLGLFGLAAFMVQRRQKEMGIRKVIGASVSQLAVLLSADFLKLVLLAFAMAIPVSWLLLARWLQTFAYHVRLDLITFLLPGLAVLLITILTVGFQTLKGAMTNPVNSLRSE